jgi:tRNA-splicing ligase RtcB
MELFKRRHPDSQARSQPGAGAADVPGAYRHVGQPVIFGGSMETGSALLVGTEHAMYETFGSTAHGAGRTMSRAHATKRVWGESLMQEMERRRIVIRTTASRSGVASPARLCHFGRSGTSKDEKEVDA